ncbi:MAG: AI-2E family transporter [Galactobacter sp.]
MSKEAPEGEGPSSEESSSKESRELKVSTWVRKAKQRIEDANAADEFDFLDPPITATARRGLGHTAQAEKEAHAKAATAPHDVPRPLRMAADYSWRIAIIVLVSAGACWGLAKLSNLVIPLMVAALLAGLLLPVKVFLEKRFHFPNALSVTVTFLLFLAAISGALYAVIRTMAKNVPDLIDQAVRGLKEVQVWLNDGPLNIGASTIDGWLNSGLNALNENQDSIVRSAASGLTSVGHFGAGLILTLFALIFFLLQGETIWRWTVGLFPRRARGAMDGAGRRGWASLVSYVRVQVVVALIDAVGIGVGAAILQVPLALPLAVLVLLGAFIPIVGAVLTGFIAVLLALVSHGWVTAIIMLAVVLFVQQVESHVLQPLIMGRAVSLHPLAVVLGVAGGSFLFGIVGALFAVPVLAVMNTVVKYLATRSWERDPAVKADQDAVEAQAAEGPVLYGDEDREWHEPDVTPGPPPARSRATGTGGVSPLDDPE